MPFPIDFINICLTDHRGIEEFFLDSWKGSAGLFYVSFLGQSRLQNSDP